MNLKQSTFVTEYLRHGDKLIAYQKAYQCHGASYRTIESSANRLLKDTEVSEAISSVQQRIRQEVEQELQEELKTELLTVQCKRELLARIATGDMWIEQEEKGRDCKTCTRMVRPTINQMLKAIDLDSKLAGHYTNKKQLTVVHATPPPQNKQEEKTNTQPSRHPELDSGSREMPEKITTKELNQLFSVPLLQEKKTSIPQQTTSGVRCDKIKTSIPQQNATIHINSFPVLREGGLSEAKDGRVKNKINDSATKRNNYTY